MNTPSAWHSVGRLHGREDRLEHSHKGVTTGIISEQMVSAICIKEVYYKHFNK